MKKYIYQQIVLSMLFVVFQLMLEIVKDNYGNQSLSIKYKHLICFVSIVAIPVFLQIMLNFIYLDEVVTVFCSNSKEYFEDSFKKNCLGYKGLIKVCRFCGQQYATKFLPKGFQITPLLHVHTVDGVYLMDKL